MALNFPIPTSVGQVYQDPTSGNTYVCTSLGPPAQWVGSGSSTSLDSTYLRKDASNDPVTGNLLLNPSTNVSPLTLQQPVGNTTPALKIENSGSGNSIEANGFAISQTGGLTLGTALAIASGGTGATTQSAARTNLGATTVGSNLFTLTNPSAITFPRFNANNTVSTLNATDFRTAVGATTVGNAVFTAANEAAARTAISAQEVFTFATWTPAYILTTSGSVTTNTASGQYLLIPPDFVWVNFLLRSASVTSPVGNVRLSLPFTVQTSLSASLTVGDADSWGAGVSQIRAAAVANTAEVALYKNAPSGAMTHIVAADLNTAVNGNEIRVSGIYRRAI